MTNAFKGYEPFGRKVEKMNPICPKCKGGCFKLTKYIGETKITVWRCHYCEYEEDYIRVAGDAVRGG